MVVRRLGSKRFIQGYVNVFKNFPGSDTTGSIGGQNQVVAGLARMFASETIDKREGLVKLPCLNQEACAICRPITQHSLHRIVILRGRRDGCGFTFPMTDHRDNGLRALSNTKSHGLGVDSSCLLARICNGFGDCTRGQAEGQFHMFGALREKQQRILCNPWHEARLSVGIYKAHECAGFK